MIKAKIKAEGLRWSSTCWPSPPTIPFVAPEFLEANQLAKLKTQIWHLARHQLLLHWNQHHLLPWWSVALQLWNHLSKWRPTLQHLKACKCIQCHHLKVSKISIHPWQHEHTLKTHPRHNLSKNHWLEVQLTVRALCVVLHPRFDVQPIAGPRATQYKRSWSHIWDLHVWQRLMLPHCTSPNLHSKSRKCQQLHIA